MGDESLELWQALLIATAVFLIFQLFAAFFSGWLALARRYRHRSRVPGETYLWATLSPRWGWRYGFVNVCITRLGLALSMPPLLSVFHPRLLIPWHAISNVISLRRWFWTDTTVFLDEPDMRLLFRGSVGRAIEKAWNERSESCKH